MYLFFPTREVVSTAKKMHDIAVQFIHKETQRRLNANPKIRFLRVADRRFNAIKI